MTKIMFVCHGNICRSPMAELIFKKMIKERGIEHKYIVSSSATSSEEIWNGVGNPVYPPAREELSRHGISCDGKRATRLTSRDYESYDMLIAMDDNNVRNIYRMLGKDTEGKVSKLLDYTGEGGEVADPWYTGNFDLTYRDICRGCEALLDYLENKGEVA